MTAQAAHREWRQFAVLSKDAVRRLLNTATRSDDRDPMPFASWVVALAATPPAMYAFGQLFVYTALQEAPAAIVEQVVLGDRMFFVVYGMAVTALLASVLWDALFPDRRDLDVVGPLPVRTRTVAAARLAAALLVCLVFAACVTGPSGLIFALITAAHPLLGPLPALLAAHLLAGLGGSLFVFVGLLIVRGLAALMPAAAVADRVATLLQFTAIVAIVEAIFYVPSLLPYLVDRMIAGGSQALSLPPVWYAGLYSWLLGLPYPALAVEARLGGLVLAAGLLVVGPLYLIAVALVVARLRETQPRGRASAATALARLVRGSLRLPPRVGALMQFAVISLVRSQRHRMVVATYAAVGAAMGLVGLLANELRGTLDAATPTRTLLALPLLLLFLLTLGLKSTFLIPTDVRANWPFRLVRLSPPHAIGATRTALLVLSVLPVSVLVGVAAWGLGWPAADAVRLTLFDTLAGALLVECLLLGWCTVPFARAHIASPDTLRSRWLSLAPPLIGFVVLGATLQLAALGSLHASAAYVLLSGSGWAGVWFTGVRRARTLHITYHSSADETWLQALNLSDAVDEV